MAEKIDELKHDMLELETLMSKHATRQKVKDILSIEFRKLGTEVMRLEELYKTSTTPSVTPTVQPTTKTYQVKLSNYAWDQTSKFVKFYVTLKDVQSLPAENVYCNFTSKSLELHVKNLGNKDYLLPINNLLYHINPEQSTWKIKSDMILVSVAKLEAINWSHVTELEKKASDAKSMPSSDLDKNADPSDGLMSIMRKMYEQGDDEMKRTIAKTWTESQQKNVGGF